MGNMQTQKVLIKNGMKRKKLEPLAVHGAFAI